MTWPSIGEPEMMRSRHDLPAEALGRLYMAICPKCEDEVHKDSLARIVGRWQDDPICAACRFDIDPKLH